MKEKIEFPTEGLERYQEWTKYNPDSFTKWSYLRNEVRAEDVVLLTTLLWPNFIEIDGIVFLAENFNEKTYRKQKRKAHWNASEYGAIVNHIHLEDAFNEDDIPPHCVMVYIGKIMRQMWECRLSTLFAKKAFVVTLDCSVEYKEYVISFKEV